MLVLWFFVRIHSKSHEWPFLDGKQWLRAFFLTVMINDSFSL